MKIIADLHIHSRFSRATSAKLTPSCLDRWARIKGIGLLGTGDCTHPEWLGILRDELEDAEDGFFSLRKNVRQAFDSGPAIAEGLPVPPEQAAVRFALTGEVSTIYTDKKGGKTRKIHHLVLLPDFKAAQAFQIRLERAKKNIRSDGRPILGMNSRDLLSMLLDADDRSVLIPAHIWTPWFSALGKNSGFDSIEECYGDLTKHIPAVETGLSSNPPMNWALESLDGFSIVSNSDAHSADKIGREATIFEMDLSFDSLRNALRLKDFADPSGGPERKPGILATVEFFPQEGKYHYDGHRDCRVVLDPEEAAGCGAICPVCEKPLTQGVMSRVLELADRHVDETAACPEKGGLNCRPYYSLIPLKEILGELLHVGPASKKVQAAYGTLIKNGGSEFSILLDKTLKEIENLSSPGVSPELLAEAVDRMRRGKVYISPGYDGEWGVIRAFAPDAGPETFAREGKGLFDEPALSPGRGTAKTARKKAEETAVEKKPAYRMKPPAVPQPAEPERPASVFTPDSGQRKIIDSPAKNCLIIAGPGTGKTAVLAAKIAALVESGVDPSSVLALSFTVKAAGELRDRALGLIRKRASEETQNAGQGLTVSTFHSLSASILREQYEAAGLPEDFRIAGVTERNDILRRVQETVKAGSGKALRKAGAYGAYIEEQKRYLLLPGEKPEDLARILPAPLYSRLINRVPERIRNPANESGAAFYEAYRNCLRDSGLVDYDGLIAGAVRLLAQREDILHSYRSKYRRVFVDEYQDINFAQYALIRLLASRENAPSLWVIGDPNQAIYGFRGSDKAFIDDFGHDYPEAERFELRKSFRCGQPIMKAAGRLANTSLEGVEYSGTGPETVSLFQREYTTGKSEAEGIARTIAAFMGGTSFFARDSGAAGSGAGGNFDFNSCAVLVRAAPLAEPVIKAFTDHGIPFEVTETAAWWEEEPFPRLLALLEERDAGGALPGGKEPDRAPVASAIKAALNTLDEEGFRLKRNNKTLFENIDQLVYLGTIFGSVRGLLDGLAGGLDAPAPGSQGVKVMTIHASKGLEFDHVFVPALEEGMLPFTLFNQKDDETDIIAEERRLLYVAMTRARRGLWLSRAASRRFRNRVIKAPASRFLGELGSIVPLAPMETRSGGEKSPGPNPQMPLF